MKFKKILTGRGREGKEEYRKYELTNTLFSKVHIFLVTILRDAQLGNLFWNNSIFCYWSNNWIIKKEEFFYAVQVKNFIKVKCKRITLT